MADGGTQSETLDEAPSAALFRPALGLIVILTLLSGILYPLVTYALANLLFPHQARGSLITDGNRVIGSELIGQSFADPRNFWSRPSATAPAANNAAASSGSNLGPLNPALRDAIIKRIAALRAADPGNTRPVPIDLVTASGSGLDPHISIAAARYQAPRVARLRGLPPSAVDEAIGKIAQSGQFGVLGAPHVDVLALNRAIERLDRHRAAAEGTRR